MTEYIHGSHPEEQERLSQLNTIINASYIELLNCQKGMKVLEVGSGVGDFAFLLADKVGENGHVLGVEIDEQQLMRSQERLSRLPIENIEFRQGNAAKLPINNQELKTFDLVHARFVLEHVTYPQEVIKEIIRALQPRGKIFVSDDDHDTLRIYPDCPTFMDLWQSYYQSYHLTDHDPYVGRKLVHLLVTSEVSNIDNGMFFFGSNYDKEDFELYVYNIIGVIESSKNRLLEKVLISEEQYDRAINDFKNWSQTRGASLWYTINWASGTIVS